MKAADPLTSTVNPREYKIAKGWAIFMWVASSLLIALFSWLLLMPFLEKDKSNAQTFWFLIPIAIAMIALGVISLIEIYKSKFIIGSNKIYSENTFSNKQLKFEEIKGYRLAEKYILIEPIDESKKKIKISTYYGRTNEIIEWLDSRFPDLDIENANLERKEILKNVEFGWTVEQREEKLNKAHKAAKIANWTGGLIGIWAWFFPKPYEYAMLAAIAMPIIAAVVLRQFNGIMRIDERNDSAHPSILIAIMVPSLTLCIRAILDYNIFDHSNAWTLCVPATLAFMGLILIGNSVFKLAKAKNFLTIGFLLILTFGYSYGAVVTLNCLYDNSEPEKFIAEIVSKRINTGKSTTYYLELTPWGPQSKTKEISVSEDLYKRFEKNDQVNIYFMKGKFGIPWFEIAD